MSRARLTKSWANRTVGSGRDKADRVKTLDGYGTPRRAIDALIEDGRSRLPKRIWEPAAGKHHIVRVLREYGKRVYTSDVYAWSNSTKKIVDFFETKRPPKGFDTILTNPPFYLAQRFAEHALTILPGGGRVYLLLRVQWLEGIKRKSLFDATPPRYVYVFSYRLPMMHAFGHRGKKMKTGMMAMAWFVFEKGFTGEPKIRWL